MGLMIIIDYMNAFIGAFIAILGIVFIPEIRKSKLKLGLTVLLGIISIAVGIIKINSDTSKDKEYNNKIDSLNIKIESINERDSLLSDKIDSSNVFLKRLEKLGVKDSSNIPYFINPEMNKFRINSVKSLQNVESHNQKGGQTAGSIVNKH